MNQTAAPALGNCPRCIDVPLAPTPAANGVIVDICPKCHGIFLDYGEVNYFVRPREMDQYYQVGLIEPHQSNLRCPKDGQPMWEGGLLNKDLQVDECSHCRGLWFDNKELAKLQQVAKSLTTLQPQPAQTINAQAERSQSRVAAFAKIAALPGLPNLFVRSVGLLGVLYALMFAFVVILTTAGGVSPIVAVLGACALIGLQYLISPFLMDLTLRWFNSLRWVGYDELPGHLKDFILRVCAENDMKPPRVGIIQDFAPNAFTYGHTPQNARVVITLGLMKILEPAELESVVAHELGHARHWDILVMTLASMIPYIFYLIFRFGLQIGSRARRNGAPFVLVAIVSFLLYVVSTYIVLFISRSREYYADRFGGMVTSNPNALSNSLVKIAYGLATMDPIVAQAPAAEQARSKRRSEGLSAIKSLGIFDSAKALNLAMASFRGPNSFNPQGIVQAMQWDLWNPWAAFYELGSTHPLPAKRIQALGKLARHLQQEPLVEFNATKPESYWDEFFVDLLFKFAPWLLALIGAALGGAAMAASGNPGPLAGLIMLGYALGYAARLLFSYRGGEYQESSVAALLSKIKVSNVRPVPCTLSGRVIGRGVPGLIWSEDMVLQDRSGFMFLDYRQPLRIIEFLFGLFRTKWLIGQDVQVKGWYRRAPTPFLEIKEIVTADGRKKRSYVYYVKWIWAALVFGASFVVGLGLTVSSL